MRPFSAFTTKYHQKVNILVTPVKVVPRGQDDEMGFSCQAIWDTGAEISVIEQSVIDELGLKPDPTEETITMVTPSGMRTATPYRVDIVLPNGVRKIAQRVLDCVSLSDGQMLIGMDIISSGDLAVTNENNNTVLSFRIPSVQTIDYVAQANVINKDLAVRQKIARSSPSKQTRAKIRATRKKHKKS